METQILQPNEAGREITQKEKDLGLVTPLNLALCLASDNQINKQENGLFISDYETLIKNSWLILTKKEVLK